MADVKTIDKVIKLGLRMRNGICEIADSIGLDKLLRILRKCFKKYELELYKPCSLFEEYVGNSWNGKDVGKGFYTYPILR